MVLSFIKRSSERKSEGRLRKQTVGGDCFQAQVPHNQADWFMCLRIGEVAGCSFGF